MSKGQTCAEHPGAKWVYVVAWFAAFDWHDGRSATVIMTERRRTQFRLRTVLLVVLLCALPLSWIAYRRERMRAHHAAIRKLERLGATVTTSFRSYSKLQGALRSIAAWDVSVSFPQQSDFGDSDIPILHRIKGLKSLDLRRTQITDRGLGSLSDLSGIEQLVLNGTHISDRGVAHLASLPQLRVLSLASTSVTDSGLEHLEDLKKLSMICLADTHVSASGLMRIRGKLPNTNVDVLGYPMGERTAALRSLAEDQLRILVNALEKYKSDVGRYPADSPGLNALFTSANAPPNTDWQGPYLVEIPVAPFIQLTKVVSQSSDRGSPVSGLADPWGQAYHYVHNERSDSPRIWSVGPDGSDGTIDDIVGVADHTNASVRRP